MHTARLKDFVEINPTVRLAKAAEYPFVPMEAITPGRRYVEAPGMRAAGGGAKFCGGDTLFARITPCLENGKIAQFKAPATQAAFGSTEYWVFRARENVSDPAYVFYLATSEIIRGPAEKSMSGASGRQRADIASVEDLEVPAPDLPTQHRIASILSAYDDLIENNMRRIAILEEMARRIYEEWFVRFRFPGHEQVKMVESELGVIPEGWSIATVNEAVERQPAGKRYDQNSVQPAGLVPVLDQGKSGVIGYHNDSPGVAASLSDPIIVFANHTCYQRVMFESFSAIQNVIPFKSSKRFERNIYWLQYATNGLVKLNDYKGHWPQFAAAKVIIPNAEIADRFGNAVAPFLHLCFGLRKKNTNLRATRDLLLPKLISGELDVSTLPEPEETIAA